jgi:hypothetical protein
MKRDSKRPFYCALHSILCGQILDFRISCGGSASSDPKADKCQRDPGCSPRSCSLVQRPRNLLNTRLPHLLSYVTGTASNGAPRTTTTFAIRRYCSPHGRWGPTCVLPYLAAAVTCSRSHSFDQRRRPETLHTAMATASLANQHDKSFAAGDPRIEQITLKYS